MSNTLYYRLIETERHLQMALDVPQDIFDKAADHSRLALALGKSAQKRVVDIEPIADGTRLLLNTKRAGKAQDSIARCREITSSLEVIRHYTPLEQADPKLNVRMGLDSVNHTGRYMMLARVAWPHSQDEVVASHATTAMRRIASVMNYMPKLILDESVYAQVDRQNGVTIETNPVGSCSLGTDGMVFNPDEPTFDVDAHNIYTPEQQLICLAGLIAIARSDEYANVT